MHLQPLGFALSGQKIIYCNPAGHPLAPPLLALTGIKDEAFLRLLFLDLIRSNAKLDPACLTSIKAPHQKPAFASGPASAQRDVTSFQM
jgi:hypothetical protein